MFRYGPGPGIKGEAVAVADDIDVGTAVLDAVDGARFVPCLGVEGTARSVRATVLGKEVGVVEILWNFEFSWFIYHHGKQEGGI